MAKTDRQYGKDYKNISIAVTPEEHKAYRLLAVEHEVSMSDIARMALADEKMWKRAARAKKSGAL